MEEQPTNTQTHEGNGEQPQGAVHQAAVLLLITFDGQMQMNPRPIPNVLRAATPADCRGMMDEFRARLDADCLLGALDFREQQMQEEALRQQIASGKNGSNGSSSLMGYLRGFGRRK